MVEPTTGASRVETCCHPGYSSGVTRVTSGLPGRMSRSKKRNPSIEKRAPSHIETSELGKRSPTHRSASSDELAGRDDRIALQQAYLGVRPLGGRSKTKVRVPPPSAAPSPEDEEARARLGALVGGGQRFRIRREDGCVEALKVGRHERYLSTLFDGSAPQATLDLHGLRAEVAAQRIVAFVRSSYADGRRLLRIVHGKGLHSAGSVGVLGDVALEALTAGGAAPLVAAFITAPRDQGGRGALLVRLEP